MVILVLSIQILLIAVLFFVCRAMHLRPGDTIAVVFCGSQKSLTTGRTPALLLHSNAFSNDLPVGMPILQTIFPDDASITVPLLVYHPMQIVLGNYLTPSLQRWLKDAQYEWSVMRDSSAEALISFRFRHHKIRGRV